MIREATDEQLIELTLERDEAAFAEIVRRWERKIFALCYGMLDGREDDARDAAQETFIAAYRNLKNFRGEAKVSSWLHRIAVNQCLSKKRRVKVRGEVAIDDDEGNEIQSFFADTRASPVMQTEQNERLKTVRKAVNALPVELKQVVIMKEFEEMTFQEIAQVLQLPISTVKSRLYTALKQLKMRLEKTPLEVV